MIFGKSKEKDMFDLFQQHLSLLEELMVEFRTTVHMYMEYNNKFLKSSKKMHLLEHQADKIKLEIRKVLLDGAFYQTLRTDFAQLVTKFDHIFGYAVIVGRKFSEERPDLSFFNPKMQKLFLEIIDETASIAVPMSNAIMYLQKDIKKIEEPCKCVMLSESKIDRLQHRLLKRLFKLDIDLAHKLQIRDLILYITNISDEGENITDIINILAMNLNV
ncbi:MAG: DUF47 domain-containing protein [Candidatus Muiribacteriota bacterium]